MKRFLLAVSCGALLLSVATAQNPVPLNRDEVGVFKKKLVTMFEALGELPAGYSKEDEDFNLPTEAYPNRNTGKFNPIHSSASRQCGTDKAVEKTNASLEKEYKKKMMEAQAKGDYVAMQKIAQEMQQKVGQTQAQAVDTHKEPIDITVSLNPFQGNTIDPDAVVMEKAGVIALKSENEAGSGMGSVTVYFDPVSLRDRQAIRDSHSHDRIARPFGGD
jgi:hypothetical protein